MYSINDIKLMCNNYDNTHKPVREGSKANTTDFDVYGIKESAIYRKDTRNRQIRDLRKSLLSECIYSVFDKALGFQLEADANDAMKRALVNNFIEEQGTQSLINSFKRSSFMLSEFARLIESTVEIVVEKCDKEKCEDIEIDPETKDQFYEKLNTEDAERVASVIKNRVSDAVDEFIQDNMTDRIEIQEIIRKTQEKVDKAKTDAIKESYDRQCKQEITKIRNRNNKNVLETMIYNVSGATLKDEAMAKLYMNESSLDMDKIVEKCTIMYTFLETVNTAKMKKLDGKYITNALNSLKK